MNINEVHPILAALIPVAEGIRDNFGSSCEVVIHDLRTPENSLFYLAGNLTGRKPGAPITNLVLEKIKQKGNSAANLIGYETTTKGGKTLKSSTIFIKDQSGEIIGCMCINFDMTNILTCMEILESFTKLNKAENETKEEFFHDVNEAMEEIVHGVLREYHKPKTLLEKEDKVNIVEKLEDKGVFLVKGAVDYVASILGVSRYTIYNYLDEVRANTSTN
ncbi:MAG: helix-turn-helix transcriptional regulator [Bacillota bacterium]